MTQHIGVLNEYDLLKQKDMDKLAKGKGMGRNLQGQAVKSPFQWCHMENTAMSCGNMWDVYLRGSLETQYPGFLLTVMMLACIQMSDSQKESSHSAPTLLSAQFRHHEEYQFRWDEISQSPRSQTPAKASHATVISKDKVQACSVSFSSVNWIRELY